MFSNILLVRSLVSILSLNREKAFFFPLSAIATFLTCIPLLTPKTKQLFPRDGIELYYPSINNAWGSIKMLQF